MTEWRPAIGKQNYTGRYEVSSDGQVRNFKTGNLLKPWAEDSGRLTVTISTRGTSSREKIHRMVARAFIPNPSEQPFVRHLNDVPNDNRVENLAWGNASSNGLDAVRNGVHPLAKKTHCPRGHEYDMSRPGGHRWCKRCDRATALSKRRKGMPDSDSKHGTHNCSLNFGCRCDRCKSAYSQYMKDRRASHAALAGRQS